MTDGLGVVRGIQSPWDSSNGWPDWITVTTPAAGANASFGPDSRYYFQVLGARASITTDANVADRLVTLDYLAPGSVTWMRNGAGVVVQASTTAQTFEWSYNRGVAEWASGTPVFAPLAPIIFPGSWTVRFTVTNIQATDALSGLKLWIVRYPTGGNYYRSPDAVTDTTD